MFKAHLSRKKISQSEAARRLGVPRMTLWRWMTGAVSPSHFAREAVKDKLGFTWPEGG